MMSNKNDPMPVLFVGHGSPTNAIEDNEYTENWKLMVKDLPRPKVILCVSAHWLTEGTRVTSEAKPKTIHDFYGFQRELYEKMYPAQGSPETAELIKEIVGSVSVKLDSSWGLDHGTWSVLTKIYPDADIPVLQLGIDYDYSPEKYFKIGQELQALREKGVLLIGSGNIVHNLDAIDFSGRTYSWATEFDEFVKEALEKKDFDALIDFQKQQSAKMAHPTYDHYLPLLYSIGASENDQVKFYNEGVTMGSVSMRCVKFGG